jgi:putative solute:sodium symporter small subunit
MKREQRVRYWKENLRYLVVLLGVWFSVSYLAGILFADALNDAGRIGGFPLGFWFANQGSIVIFVLIIAAYALLMARLDSKYGVYDD